MAGTQLKSAIKEAGLTQEVVADHLGVTQSAVSLWVLGKSRPEVERVAELADLIHADAVELVLAWWPELKQTDRLAGIGSGSPVPAMRRSPSSSRGSTHSRRPSRHQLVDVERGERSATIAVEALHHPRLHLGQDASEPADLVSGPHEVRTGLAVLRRRCVDQA